MVIVVVLMHLVATNHSRTKSIYSGHLSTLDSKNLN
jgi:hypothetical protein